MFRCELPWPPSLNHAVKHTRNGIHYRTPAAREWRGRAVYLIEQSLDQRAPLLFGPCRVRLDLFAPNRRRYDIDGKVKEVLDAMQGIVYGNDRQVRELHVVAHDDACVAGGRCTVAVDALRQTMTDDIVVRKRRERQPAAACDSECALLVR